MAQQWRNQFTPYLTLPELTARGLETQNIKAGSLFEGTLRYLSIFSFSQCCGSGFIEFGSGSSISVETGFGYGSRSRVLMKKNGNLLVPRPP